MEITVMSFNVQHCCNFLTGKIDYDVMADAIRAQHADIIGLNEIYGAGEVENFEPQAQRLAEKLGYHYYFAKAIDVFDKPSPYGNALLSRFPIRQAVTIPVPDPVQRSGQWYESRCLLKAEIETEGGDLTVCVIHFGLNPEEQVNAAETVMANLPANRGVLMGDFNVLPTDPVLDPIRAQLYDTADLFEGERLSWPSDKPERKIDYLFTTRDLRVVSADIPAVIASDHRPYVAKVVL